MAKKKFTDKQKMFIKEYIVDFNATQAAIRSGYSKKTAYSQGDRLLKNVGVKQELARLKEEIREESQDHIAFIRQEHRRLALLAEQKGDLVNATRNLEGYGKTYAAYTDNLNTTNQEHAADLSPEQEEQARAAIQAIRQGPRLSKEAV